jgi:geranylgeranyl diphosphate synthase type II
MIHTYSLIHDDLPAMDNDDTRRPLPTSHKVYGEAMAILAGDALLTEAFRLLASLEVKADRPAARCLQAIGEIATAAGCGGMVGGQAADVRSEGKTADGAVLDYIHTRKTGALIIASLRAGAIVAGAPEPELAALTGYGRHMGLAFQIADDLLNVEGNAALLGKKTGSDAARGKMTYPAWVGVAESRRRAERLILAALEALEPFTASADPLRWICSYVIRRQS